MQVLEKLRRGRAQDRDAVGRHVGGGLPSCLLHRRQLILNMWILSLIRLQLLSLLVLVLVLLLPLLLVLLSLLVLLLSLMRRLLGVRGVSGGRSAVARVAGDRIAVSVTWICVGLSVLLALPIDEGLTVAGRLAVSVVRGRLVVAIRLLGDPVGRILLIRLRDEAGLLPGGRATVLVGWCRVCCSRVAAGSIRSADGWLAVRGMLHIARSSVVSRTWMMSLLLGTVPDHASILRVVAGALAVRDFRRLNRENGKHRQRRRDRVSSQKHRVLSRKRWPGRIVDFVS